MRKNLSLIAASGLLALAGCSGGNGDATADANQFDANQAQANAQAPDQPDRSADLDPAAVERARALALGYGSDEERGQWRQQARTEMEGLRFVVDQSDRELRVYRGDEVVRTHDVAVGTEDNPTPTGEFAFHRVRDQHVARGSLGDHRRHRPEDPPEAGVDPAVADDDDKFFTARYRRVENAAVKHHVLRAVER